MAAAACGGGNDSPSTPTGPSGPSTPLATYSVTDLVVGEGAEAVPGRVVSVHYTLWVYDPAQPESKGQQLETSRGFAPIRFVLGAREVIRGWEEGLPGMRVGGQRRLVIPPSLAYGGTTHPLANASLVFDVELVGVD